MKKLILLVPVFLISLSVTADAGTASFADGQGSWRSTLCMMPRSPASESPHDSEAAADSLNARLAAHQQYVNASEQYMKCVSDEAQRDAQSVSLMIKRAAEAEISKTVKDANSSAETLSHANPVIISGDK